MKYVYKILNFFFKACNNIILFCTKYPFLIIAFVLVLVGSIVLLMIKNDSNVGGILGKLLGFMGIGNSSDTTQQANTIPADRKEALGEADKQGFVQYKVSELPSSSNPFRDKSIVSLPNGQKVKLPDGVKDTDVDIVIQTQSSYTIIPTPEVHKQLLDTQQAIQSAEATNTQAADLLARLKAKQ